MTWNDLGDMSLVTTFRFRVSILPVIRCLSVSNGFLPKEAPFIFLPLPYNGEVAKLTWPWVTDIKIPRYTFYKYWYGYQSLKVSMWSGIQWSYDEHSNFFLRWGHLMWPGDLTVSDLGRQKIFHNMCGKDVWAGIIKRRRGAPPFLRYSRKTWGGVKTPPALQHGTG